MRMCLDLEIMLMSQKLSEEDSLPYLENFLTYTEEGGSRDVWNFLYFLNFNLKDFRKNRGLESFKEFMDYKWPPKEKITCSDDADD